MVKDARKKGMEQHPIPIKKTVFSKQHSLISLTRRILKSKKDAMHTQVPCGMQTYFYTVLIRGQTVKHSNVHFMNNCYY